MRNYKHQTQSIKFHLSRNNSANFSDPGTGKSRIAIKTILERMKQGGVERALVVCPKTLLWSWRDEIWKHANRKSIVVTGTRLEKLHKLRLNGSQFILNYESTIIPTIFQELQKMAFDMIVWDESTYLKNHQSKRSQANYLIGKDIDFKLLLSGTPYTESLTDLYSQFKVLDGGQTFGSNYYKFFRHYYQPVLRYVPGVTSMFRGGYWRLKSGAHDEVKRKMVGKAIRFVKDDCLDLPDRIFSRRWSEWDKKSAQYKDYIQVEADIITELTKVLKVSLDDILFKKDIEWTTYIPNVLVKMSKLQQIAAGWYYTGMTAGTKAYDYKTNPKLDALCELLEECLKHGKVVIFAHFIHDRELISNLKDFKKYIVDDPVRFAQSKPKIFLGSQVKSGMGLNLQVAHQMIYYTNHWGLEKRLQSRDRIYRIGQREKCLYYDVLMRDSIDVPILDKLDKKWSDAEAILEWIRCKSGS